MSEDIKKACEVLRSGGLILYPTDTIWGIGCDATNEEAVQRVYNLKKRADQKAMLILLDSTAKLETYASDIPDVAWDLIDLSDKPLTVIFSHARNIAPNLIADDGSIGIRVTQEDFSRKLCERFRKPVVSTSANISGQPSPANFLQISDEIKDGVDYIVQYRQKDNNESQPSSIIKLGDGGIVQIIR
ncbi:threonylcarbamoyl-AMP synthase [Parabacteroides sp. OttesenSCG-928-G07]|nr:threonylcarbamoyl-AMP synthase [Parabacteroides sp. OttesenSCG-928-G21]MDL2277244.1 threonylcarbamoyl-AMP synthase [Parabacteroides sp. OttesenSCG-928-G07]